jgi:hypothetical protein
MDSNQHFMPLDQAEDNQIHEIFDDFTKAPGFKPGN